MRTTTGSYICLFALINLACTSCNKGVEFSSQEQNDIAPPSVQSIVYVSTATQRGFEIYLSNDLQHSFLLTWGGFSFQPSWSPDKQWIIYERGFLDTTGFQIWKMKYNGDSKTRLTNPADDAQSARWSPDGTRIAFHMHRAGRIDIFTMDPSGANVQQVTTGATVPFWTNAAFLFADWSNDSKSLMFTYQRGDGPIGNSSLGIITLANGNFRSISFFDTLRPFYARYSPTRDEITFVGLSPNSTVGPQIFRAATDGSELITISDCFWARDPDWSADGERIIYTRYESSVEDPSEIWSVNRDGSNQRRLLHSSAFCSLLANW